MNYEQNYYDLMSYCQSLNRKRHKGEYYERHHILPKSIYPEYAKLPENLVLLTAREHFLAHYLLTKFYEGENRNKMVFAFMLLVNGNTKFYDKHFVEKVKCSRQYERIKKDFANLHSEMMTGREVTEHERIAASIAKKKYFSNPNNIEKAKEQLDSIRHKAIEATIAKAKEKMSHCPDLIKNETVERLQNYIALYDLNQGVARKKKVLCICPKCKKEYTVLLRAFVGQHKDSFVCGACKARERQLQSNTSVESRHKRGLVSDEKFKDYLEKRKC